MSLMARIEAAKQAKQPAPAKAQSRIAQLAQDKSLPAKVLR